MRVFYVGLLSIRRGNVPLKALGGVTLFVTIGAIILRIVLSTERDVNLGWLGQSREAKCLAWV